MKYFRLLVRLFRYNAAREVEFRANFLILTLVDVIWVALQLVLVELLFGFTDRIGMWSKAEVLILMGLFRIVKGLFSMLFRPNLFQLPTLVNKGELDTLLTKPIESQFLASMNRIDLTEWAEIALGGGILFYGLTLRDQNMSAFFFGQLGVSVILGLTMFYSLMFIFSTLSFYIQRLTALSAFYDTLSQVLRYPVDAIGYRHEFLVTFLLPVAIVITTPTKMLLGRASPIEFAGEFAFAGLLLLFTHYFWKHALRRYSSASS